ncbi:MAG: hypothetical protein KBC56_05470 [Flavobacterium sp.]|nr:hypothetical protein [Flavobacterium sp.]
MKKEIKMAVLVLLMSTTMVFANQFSPVEDFPKAMKEITTYLNQARQMEDLDENLKSVKVTFTITTDNEMVVLDLRTKNAEIKSYVKKALNHKLLNSGDLIPGKTYVFKVLLKN